MAPHISVRRRLALLALVVYLGAAIIAYYCALVPSALPERDSDEYLRYVESFQLGLAAMDLDETDEVHALGVGDAEVFANRKFTEAIQLIPAEPTAWANRGLWFLRKDRLPEAAADLQQAAKLAPENPAIQRLLGILASKKGNMAMAALSFRAALNKDREDLPTLMALVGTMDATGKEGADREILELLNEGLRIEPNNLCLLHWKTEHAAVLGDCKALHEAVEGYKRQAPEWSGTLADRARDKLKKLDEQAHEPLPRDVGETALVLDMCLKPEHHYRRDALAAPRFESGQGEPVREFLRLAPMRSTASPPDRDLTFAAASPLDGDTDAIVRARWDVVLPVWLTRDARPAVFVANAREVRQVNGAGFSLPFPGGEKSTPPTPYGVLAVDWNNDFRSDLLFAGAGGLCFFEQNTEGRFADITEDIALDPATLNADYFGAWAEDIDQDGNLDLVLAPRQGQPIVLRNNGNGTFTATKLFPGVEGARAFVWADLDGDGDPDAIFLDSMGRMHVFVNERHAQFRERTLPEAPMRYLALTVADLTRASGFDLIALREDGVVQRFTNKNKGKAWEVAELARWPEFPAGRELGSHRLLAADLDNNGAIDLIVASAAGSRIWLGNEDEQFSPLGDLLSEEVFAAAGQRANGRLDLLALSKDGQPVDRVNRGKIAYHWQVIHPRMQDRIQGGLNDYDRINSFGIGGVIELRSGLLMRKQRITAPVVHFGLGIRPRVSVTRVRWPNSALLMAFDVKPDTEVEIEQRVFVW